MCFGYGPGFSLWRDPGRTVFRFGYTIEKPQKSVFYGPVKLDLGNGIW